MMNSTGSIISELRKEAGFTQKTLAEAVHVTDKAVSKWERGLCLPDVALLPKLSVLLNADIELLLGRTGIHPSKWVGVIDLKNYDCNLSSSICSKPIVSYLLCHYLILGITEIYFRTNEKNINYLQNSVLEKYGFKFCFEFEKLSENNLMIMNRPCFLFGSDLTRHFQTAMLSESIIKLVPSGASVPFLFCPAEYSFMYLKNPEYLYEIATVKTLGRGMVCIDIDNEKLNDISSFVRIYEKNTKLKIADLDEIKSNLRN